uniref:Integral membrane protein n=1 Tax=Streptomyces sp. NBC_00049 TaxID=2903617 RepID=A0AAU2JPK7_9ACTN
MDMTKVGLRGLRAALFSAVVVLLSAGSHVLMSQAPLPPALVGGAFAAVFAISYALADRERGFGPIAGLLVPLELAADTVFTTGQHVCYGPAGGPVSGPLRAIGLDELCGGPPVGGPLTEVAGNAADPAALLAAPGPWAPWLLLGAHVSVGLLAAAWLRHGERALGRLLRAAAACAFRPLLLAAAVVAVASGRVRRALRPVLPGAGARTRFPAHSVGRRGPPVRGALVSA